MAVIERPKLALLWDRVRTNAMGKPKEAQLAITAARRAFLLPGRRKESRRTRSSGRS
jgi:hypothetical protein